MTSADAPEDPVERLLREWADDPNGTLPEFVDDGVRTKMLAARDHLGAAIAGGISEEEAIARVRELLETAEDVRRIAPPAGERR